MIEKAEKEILSVGDYLEQLNATLKKETAKIIGEVTEIKAGPSGHVYFSLKDEKVAAVIPCVIWSFKYRAYGIELREGLKIIATGTPNIYAPYGKFTFVADTIELAGEGAIKIAYEKLKKKLESEGLFSAERKREIPPFPKRIGLITSRNGAVIHDFSVNLAKFGFEIFFVDSKVEGQEAVDDLLNAVKILKTKKIDVLVLMRGGGSLESFQAFNNENLARELSSFPAPVLTGIGHEKDVPIVALVSDKNVSTPTAVANLLSKGWNEAASHLRLYESKILAGFDSALRGEKFKIVDVQNEIEKRFSFIFDTWKNTESKLNFAFERVGSEILRKHDTLNLTAKNLTREFEIFYSRVVETIERTQKMINQGDPMRQLSFGYSIARLHGKIVRSVASVSNGEELDVTVADGIIRSIIR